MRTMTNDRSHFDESYQASHGYFGEEPERILVFSLSSALLIIGIAITKEFDVIIASMALGVTLTNLGSKRVLSSFDLVHRFAAPVYVLFFVIVGARLNISSMGLQVGLLVAAYVIGSVVGKTSGAWFGAKRSKAAPTIRKYLGFCLYQQGAIAIALLLMATNRFEGEIRDTMLSVIIAGVFVLQLAGPMLVKISAKKAGEVGLNITEEDLIRLYKVEDVLDDKVPAISAGLSLNELIKVVADTNSYCYPVVDNAGKLTGIITLDGIMNTFATQELNDWLVAFDLVEPVIEKAVPQMPLSEALETAKEMDVEFLPVVAGDDAEKYVGILNVRSAHRRLAAEVLAKQKEADRMYSHGHS